MLVNEVPEPARVALAHGLEPPAARFLVEPAELDGGLDREVFLKFILADLLIPGRVVDPDERVPHLAEILPPLVGLVDGHHDDQLGDPAVNLAELDEQGLVVTVAVPARLVIPRRLDRAVGRLRIVVEDEELLIGDLAVRTEHEDRGVEVEGRPRAIVRVPTEADPRLAQPNPDTLAFLEIDRHLSLSSSGLKVAHPGPESRDSFMAKSYHARMPFAMNVGSISRNTK